MVKEILIGNDLIEEICFYDIILVGTSIKNRLGNGFQKDIAINFPVVDTVNKQTQYDDIRKLGTCQVINYYKNKGFPTFILCYITKGRYRPDKQPDTLDYDALRTCLSLINENFKGKKIAAPLLGSSKYEGNGNREKIYEIIKDTCNDIDLYIYDFDQQDFAAKNIKRFKEIKEKYSGDEFDEKLKKLLWEEHFGKYVTEFPSELSIYEIKKKIKEYKNKKND